MSSFHQPWLPTGHSALGLLLLPGTFLLIVVVLRFIEAGEAFFGSPAIPNLTLPCSRGCFALGCCRFECFEHEVKQLLPAFKQNVLQQGTQVLKESAARR